MRLLILQESIGKFVAHYIYHKIITHQQNTDQPFVLGLPTGSTPLIMYQELIKLYQQHQISFKNVVTFNMDEYVGLDADNKQSYHYYMFQNFFNHIDIQKDNIHILNGCANNLETECINFENKIIQYGGIDLMVGGIGEDGHIAFNEPGSSFNSITRIKTLNHSTILANSRFFDNDIVLTPKTALTMGIKTILNAKEIIILACGANKSHAVMQAIEGSVSSMCPVTALQMHNKTALMCDEYAAYELKLKTIKYFANMEDHYTKYDNSSCL